MKPAGVICDIEGTTSSISFVHKVLFPLSLDRLEGYLNRFGSDPEVVQQLTVLWAKIHGDNKPEGELSRLLVPILKEYIISDVKDTTLKWIQGRIWKEAFESGAIKGHVYPEVSGVLKGWHISGKKLFVYSSGSVEAQQLLFRYSESGDLTPLFSGYFDTTIGGKRESISYAKISERVGLSAERLLFLSDVPEELNAARTAGMQTCLLLREGAIVPAGYSGFTASDFIEVDRQFFTAA